MNIARILAALAAANSGAALILRYILADGSPVEAIWSLYGFFTIITNTAVFLVAGAMALAPASRLAGPTMRHAVVTAIVAVGIVYSVALRGMVELSGASLIADHMCHDLAPVLFLLAWIASRHGTLTAICIPKAVILPGLYLVYAMIRGAFTGWYPYWFLNPDKIGVAQLLVAVVLNCAVFALLATVFWIADRWLARKNLRTPA